MHRQRKAVCPCKADRRARQAGLLRRHHRQHQGMDQHLHRLVHRLACLHRRAGHLRRRGVRPFRPWPFLHLVHHHHLRLWLFLHRPHSVRRQAVLHHNRQCPLRPLMRRRAQHSPPHPMCRLCWRPLRLCRYLLPPSCRIHQQRRRRRSCLYSPCQSRLRRRRRPCLRMHRQARVRRVALFFQCLAHIRSHIRTHRRPCLRP